MLPSAVGEWLAGPALLPEYTIQYAGPECDVRGACPDVLRVMIASAAFHALQFVSMLFALNVFDWYKQLKHKDQLYLVSSVVSTVHALVTSYGSFQHVFFPDTPLPEESFFFISSPGIDFYAAYCVGYFLYDFVVMHLYPKVFWSVEIFIHHFISGFFFPLVFFIGAGAHVVAFALIMEASNPFVNARWILSTLGFKSHPMYQLNALLLVIVFTIARPISLIYMLYRFYINTEDLTVVPTFFLGIMGLSIVAGFALNFYWYYKIISGALALFTGKKKDEGKKAESKKTN